MYVGSCTVTFRIYEDQTVIQSSHRHCPTFGSTHVLSSFGFDHVDMTFVSSGYLLMCKFRCESFDRKVTNFNFKLDKMNNLMFLSMMFHTCL